MQFLYLKPRTHQALQDLHPQILVKVDVIVQKHSLLADGTYHPVSMSENLVPIPGDEKNIALKKVFQNAPETYFVPHAVFLEHLVRHQYAVLELHYIAPVYHKWRLDCLELQRTADGLVRGNIFRCRFQVVGIVHILD